MNRITRIAALALTVAAAGSAFADDITIDTTPQTSLKTRAEVQVELAQFQQQRVNPWSSSYNVLAGFQSSRNRADVTAEVKAARASGELAAMARHAGTPTRNGWTSSSTRSIRWALPVIS